MVEPKSPLTAASLTVDQQKKLMEIIAALPLKLSEIKNKENSCQQLEAITFSPTII